MFKTIKNKKLKTSQKIIKRMKRVGKIIYLGKIIHESIKLINGGIRSDQRNKLYLYNFKIYFLLCLIYNKILN